MDASGGGCHPGQECLVGVTKALLPLLTPLTHRSLSTGSQEVAG